MRDVITPSWHQDDGRCLTMLQDELPSSIGEASTGTPKTAASFYRSSQRSIVVVGPPSSLYSLAGGMKIESIRSQNTNTDSHIGFRDSASASGIARSAPRNFPCPSSSQSNLPDLRLQWEAASRVTDMAKKLSQELPSDVDPSMHGHPARSETAPSAISDPHAPTENPPVAGLAPEAMEVWRDATDLLREREHDQIHPISGDPAVTTHAGAQVSAAAVATVAAARSRAQRTRSSSPHSAMEQQRSRSPPNQGMVSSSRRISSIGAGLNGMSAASVSSAGGGSGVPIAPHAGMDRKNEPVFLSGSPSGSVTAGTLYPDVCDPRGHATEDSHYQDGLSRAASAAGTGGDAAALSPIPESARKGLIKQASVGPGGASSSGTPRASSKGLPPSKDTVTQLQLYSALLFFSGTNDVEEMQTIVREGLNIREVKDYDGRTPLHLAASEDSVSAAEWLMSMGVDMSAVDRFGRTPLMDALANNRSPAVAQLLLQAGARVFERGTLVHPTDSRAYAPLVCAVPAELHSINHPDWEIELSDLHLGAAVGEGEFGVVHNGLWNGTPVAIKVLKPDHIRREQLASEINSLLKVHHPNIVQFLGACTREEPVMIVSELMEGGSLEQALRRRRNMPLRRVLEIARDCARGLNYLHLANPHAMIHRDLKPSNIMFGGLGSAMGPDELALDTGVAKVADFGLSKTIASLAPKFPEGSQVMGEFDAPEGAGAEPSRASLASATARGSNGSRNKIVPLVSPSRKGTFDGFADDIHETGGSQEGAEGGLEADELRSKVAKLARGTSPGADTGKSGSSEIPAGAPGTSDNEVTSFLSQPFEMTGGTGSYIFMAGEIFRHEPYNTKADIYSFGMIMYQMLTGSRPFSGMEPSKAAMRASVDGLRPEWPASPVHYSADDCAALGNVQNLVERCWAHEPMSRPSSAEVIQELDCILADLSSPRQRYKDILNAGSPTPKPKPKAKGFGFIQNLRTSRNGSPRVGKEFNSPTVKKQASKELTSAHLPAGATHNPAIFAALAAAKGNSGPLADTSGSGHARSASSGPLAKGRCNSGEVTRAPSGRERLSRMAQRRSPMLPDRSMDASSQGSPEATVGVSGSDGAVFIPQASPQLEAEESEGQRGRGFERGVGMLANLRAEHLAVHNSRSPDPRDQAIPDEALMHVDREYPAVAPPSQMYPSKDMAPQSNKVSVHSRGSPATRSPATRSRSPGPRSPARSAAHSAQHSAQHSAIPSPQNSRPIKGGSGSSPLAPQQHEAAENGMEYDMHGGHAPRQRRESGGAQRFGPPGTPGGRPKSGPFGGRNAQATPDDYYDADEDPDHWDGTVQRGDTDRFAREPEEYDEPSQHSAQHAQYARRQSPGPSGGASADGDNYDGEIFASHSSHPINARGKRSSAGSRVVRSRGRSPTGGASERSGMSPHSPGPSALASQFSQSIDEEEALEIAERLAGNSQMEGADGEKKSRYWWLDFIKSERKLAKKRKAKKEAQKRGEVWVDPDRKAQSANLSRAGAGRGRSPPGDGSSPSGEGGRMWATSPLRQSGNSATSGSPSRARSQGLTTPGDSTMGGAEGEGKSSSWVWQFIKDERERAKMRACEKKGIPYTGPGDSRKRSKSRSQSITPQASERGDVSQSTRRSRSHSPSVSEATADPSVVGGTAGLQARANASQAQQRYVSALDISAKINKEVKRRGNRGAAGSAADGGGGASQIDNASSVSGSMLSASGAGAGRSRGVSRGPSRSHPGTEGRRSGSRSGAHMHDEHDMSTSRNLNPKSSLNAGAAFGSPAMHAADASGKFMHADQLGDVGGHPGTSAHAGYDPDIVDGIESYGPDDNMDGQHEVPPGTPRHSTRAHLPSFGEDERTLEAEDGPEVMEQDEIYEEEGEYVQIVRDEPGFDVGIPEDDAEGDPGSHDLMQDPMHAPDSMQQDHMISDDPDQRPLDPYDERLPTGPYAQQPIDDQDVPDMSRQEYEAQFENQPLEELGHARTHETFFNEEEGGEPPLSMNDANMHEGSMHEDRSGHSGHSIKQVGVAQAPYVPPVAANEPPVDPDSDVEQGGYNAAFDVRRMHAEARAKALASQQQPNAGLALIPNSEMSDTAGDSLDPVSHTAEQSRDQIEQRLADIERVANDRQMMSWDLIGGDAEPKDRFVPSVAPIHEVDSKLDSKLDPRSADASMHDTLHNIMHEIEQHESLQSTNITSSQEKGGRSHFAQVQDIMQGISADSEPNSPYATSPMRSGEEEILPAPSNENSGRNKSEDSRSKNWFVQFVKDERARSKKKKSSARGASPQNRRGVSPHAMSTGGDSGVSGSYRSRGTSPEGLSTMSGTGMAAAAAGGGTTHLQTAAQLAISITQNMSESTEPSMHGQSESQTESRAPTEHMFGLHTNDPGVDHIDDMVGMEERAATDHLISRRRGISPHGRGSDAYSRQVQQAAAAPGDRSVQSSAAGQSSTNSDAIKQRIAGDTSTLQKRARQRAEAARRQAADDASAITGITGDESYHMRDMDASVGGSTMYDGADLPSYGAPTGGGRFAQAAAIAQMVQPPSPPRGVPRNKELMPGSEQSYHMEASTSYMDGLADGHSTATGGGSSAREPAWHTTPLPPKLSPQQQQARMHRNDTDEDPRRPGVPPSKGGTSVSSGTGIFVDGAKDGEGKEGKAHWFFRFIKDERKRSSAKTAKKKANSGRGLKFSMGRSKNSSGLSDNIQEESGDIYEQ